MSSNPISLLELSQRISYLVQQPETQNVWVVAELQDVNVRGGHCYMELLQKDERGQQLARMRGCCWARVYGPMARNFYAASGQQFATGLKVMLKVSAMMHPVFGLTLNVTDVNPEYTMGDLIRRRNEIIRRLTDEGVIDLNRRLTWPSVIQRVAIVSSPGAAGYGDFMNQLYNNPSHIRFTTRLFPATMQGALAPSSIISALTRIAEEEENWDGVVIIRGGGATSDLQAYEDYDLASAVAQFPLPVAIGIGHERDITVLDWVANCRLKTPTAVAEWLITQGEGVLGWLAATATRILQLANERMAGDRERLAQAQALLPVAVSGVVQRAQARLSHAVASLSGVPAAQITPARMRLDIMPKMMKDAISVRLSRQRDLVENAARLLDVLSPAATLARGYSITRIDGHVVSSASAVMPGDTLEITFADGSLIAHTP